MRKYGQEIVDKAKDKLNSDIDDLEKDKQDNFSEIDKTEVEFFRYLKGSERSIAAAEYNKLEEESILNGVAYNLTKKSDLDPEVSDIIKDEYYYQKKQNEEKREDLKLKTPESYYLVNTQDYLTQINKQHKGEIVDVPSVKETKDWLIEKMEQSQPVFLHGHLGAGKTEVARTAATERMIDLNINRDLKEYLDENPEASEKDIVRQYRVFENRYQNALKNGDKETLDKLAHYEVVGSRTTTTEDLYTETALTARKTESVPAHKIIDKINQELELFEQDHPQASDQELEQARRKIEQTVLQNNSEQIATVSEKIHKQLSKAITEGRPIIIDEVNLIEPNVLASMNGILTARPGDYVDIPGNGRVQITEGFSVILTGNLNSTTKASYAGVNSLNAAFLSRLSEKAYDYVEQSKEGSMENQADPRQNELFYIMMTKLADKKGNIELPQGSIEDIFKLCQLAKVTQDIFSGKWEESAFNADSTGDFSGEKPELESYVLSVRHVMRIIEAWDKGRNQDLSMALWTEFLGSIDGENINDQHLILEQAKLIGLFDEKKGWKIDTMAEELKYRAIQLSDIRTEKYDYKKPENEFYSTKDMVDLLYGEPNTKTDYSMINLEVDKNSDLGEKITNIEVMEGWVNKLSEMKTASESLKEFDKKVCSMGA